KKVYYGSKSDYKVDRISRNNQIPQGNVPQDAHHGERHGNRHPDRQGVQQHLGRDIAPRNLLHFVVQNPHGRFGENGQKSKDKTDGNRDPADRFRHENFAHRFPGGHKTDVNPLQKQGQSQEGQDHPDKNILQFFPGQLEKEEMEKQKEQQHRKEGHRHFPEDFTKSFPHADVHPYSTPISITARIGPMDARATRPNPSPEELFPRMTEATPTPRATMKGTVIGPVVTPPESKEIGANSLGVNRASRKTRA